MSRRELDPNNFAALDRFWRRSSFHDEVIEEVRAINRRVVIRLRAMTLVVTDVTHLQRCADLPTVWLDATIAESRGRWTLDIATEDGPLRVTGADVRLIRNADLAVLIPPVDC